jgi:GT2 family glycosyltransferase
MSSTAPISPESNRPLTWGLAIATFQRRDMLCRTVEYALKQSRPPVEVVICDSSSDWLETRQAVNDIVNRNAPAVRLQYIFSDIAQQTVQRARAAAVASADVLFMIDDDAFLRVDAAEQVLAVYEADVDGRVVAVGPGVMSKWIDFGTIDDSQPDAESPPGLLAKLVHRLMGGWTMFRPVRAVAGPLPQSVHPISRTRFMDGYRLTARRSAVQKVAFDENLVSNRFEDLDACLQLIRLGLLVRLHRPLIFHAAGVSMRGERKGILSRFGWILNLCYLNRKYCGGGVFVRLFCWFLWARFAAFDLFTGMIRRDLFRFKGCLHAMPALWRMTWCRQDTIGNLARYEGLSFRKLMAGAKS